MRKFLAGTAFAALLLIVGYAAASRNSGGTFSLYTPGNPAVTNQTISSSLWNNTFSDIGTELTDSLSRSGKGPMLAPLKNVDGTKAAPAYTFNTETASGDYRAGSNDLRKSVNNTDVEKWLATGPTSLLPHTFTGTAAEAEIILPPVTAPTTPTNGGLWTTSAGMFARINGATVQLQPRAYAELSYQNTAGGAATYSSSTTATNTLTVITGTGTWNTSAASSNMTVNTTNGTIQVALAGTYEIRLVGHVQQTTCSTTCQMAFWFRKNASTTGMPLNTIGSSFGGAGFVPVNLNITLVLAANDTIDVGVFNGANATSMTVNFSWLELVATLVA